MINRAPLDIPLWYQKGFRVFLGSLRFAEIHPNMRIRFPPSISPFLPRSRSVKEPLFSYSSISDNNPTSEQEISKETNSDAQFLGKPVNPTSPNQKIKLKTEKPISKDPHLTLTHVTEVLLAHRNDPDSALEHFKRAERKKKLLADVVSDPVVVLAHILSCSKSHCGAARMLISKYVSRLLNPSPGELVDQLITTAKRFEFDLDSNSRVVNYLLAGYVGASRYEDAVVCYNKMIENSIYPWAPFIHSLLKALAKNNMMAEARVLFKDVVTREIPYLSATIPVMIRGCLKEGKTEEAAQYFWDAKANGVKLDPMIYSTAIYAVCKKFDSVSACALLDEMKEKGWVPSEGTYTNVITTCVVQRNMSDAIRLKDEMISNEIPMNLVVLKSLMKGYCHQKSLHSAFDLFDEIFEHGLSPNEDIYSVLIVGCLKNGDIQKGLELYTKMKKENIRLKAFNAKCLIWGFLEAGLIEEAMKLFHEAIEIGITDVYTYNHLMFLLCKLGKVNEASSIWDKMVKNGVSPTVVSYNNIILGQCRKGNMEAAADLFTEMQERGPKANVVTFSILINGYFSKGKSEQALATFDKMVELGIAPSDYTFNTVINGLCKVGQTSDACSMLKKVVDAGFTPTCMTYNSIIHGFVKEGNVNSALAVYSEMCEAGILPNVVTYTSLINGFCKCKNMDLALKFRDKMRSKGLELDVTAYGALIDGFCKHRDMRTAREFFDELHQIGLSPNANIYNSMISGYRNLDNIEEALSLHKKMVDDGIACDLALYTTLIDGLLKAGEITLASNLYTEVLAKNMAPDIIMYTVLVNGLCNKHQLKNARKVFEEMKGKNMVPNVIIYNSLIGGYFRKGSLQEAFRLHDEMLDRGLVPDDATFDVLVKGKVTGNESVIETS